MSALSLWNKNTERVADALSGQLSLLTQSALERRPDVRGSRRVRRDLVRFLNQSRTRGLVSNGSIAG
jgi:hypothetical protein